MKNKLTQILYSLAKMVIILSALSYVISIIYFWISPYQQCMKDFVSEPGFLTDQEYCSATYPSEAAKIKKLNQFLLSE